MFIQDAEIVTRRGSDVQALTAQWLSMTSVADWHTLALGATGRVVAAVPADRWQAATPCPGWDVRALVNHLVSGNLWAASIGAGARIKEVGGRLDGDLRRTRHQDQRLETGSAPSGPLAAADTLRGSPPPPPNR